jgi:hypothetical protein
LKVVRPEEDKAPVLSINEIMEIIDAAQDRRRNDLAQAKIPLPDACFDGRIVVQTLY